MLLEVRSRQCFPQLRRFPVGERTQLPLPDVSKKDHHRVIATQMKLIMICYRSLSHLRDVVFDPGELVIIRSGHVLDLCPTTENAFA